jgi:TonB family protein
MERSNKHRNHNLLKYLRYFGDHLTGREKHAFEKSIMQDKFEEEAFDGLSQLSYDELRNDLSELENRLRTNDSKKRILFLPIFKYAAAVLLLIGVGTIVYMLSKSVEKISPLAEKIKPDTLFYRAVPPLLKDTTPKKIVAQQIRNENTEKIEIKPSESPITFEETFAEEEAKKEPISADEVVVLGYGVQERAKETAAKELRKDTNPKVEFALIGRTAGVNISDDQKDKKVLIRGTKSMTGNSILIKGKVISSTDELPLPGVTITAEGTGTGTISDVDGYFSIEIPSNSEPVLDFSYVGYVTASVKATDSETLEVKMDEDLIALDEVVVIGYGTTKKADLTGAVSSVKMDEETANDQPSVINPKPADGMKAFRDYVRNNIRYTNLPLFDKTQVVKLQFTIGAQGSLSDISVEKSAGEAFDNEAIRIVKEGPKWSPATQDGRPIPYTITLKIKFEPQKAE